MINAIIFDFGDVFINLDKQATMDGLKNLGISEWNEDLNQLNLQYEIGAISKEDFLSGIQKHTSNASIEDILRAWNAILLNFPLYLYFLTCILSFEFNKKSFRQETRRVFESFFTDWPFVISSFEGTFIFSS